MSVHDSVIVFVSHILLVKEQQYPVTARAENFQASHSHLSPG